MLLVAAAGGAFLTYLYLQSKNVTSSPSTFATPSPLLVEPQAPDLDEENLVHEVPSPTPIPTPAMTLEEEALSWLKVNPQLVPRTVTLTKACEFPIVFEGVAQGKTTIAAGATSAVEGWDENSVAAVYAASERRVPHESTDFMEQVLRLYEINKALDSVVLPTIDLTDVTLSEALTFIQEQTELHATDDTMESVTFVLIKDINNVAMTITLSLEDTPLRDVLMYLCQLASLQYTITADAIIFSSAPSATP